MHKHKYVIRFCCVQVSKLSSQETTSDPPAGSKVIQELRRKAASLEEELTQLQALVRKNY